MFGRTPACPRAGAGVLHHPCRVLLAGGLAAVGVFASPAPALAAGGLQLTTDARGPMFTGLVLTPGRPVTRCVQVAWTGSLGERIGLSAQLAPGGLESYLTVTVQTGTGGSYADCSGFVGTTSWTGTLAALAAAHPASSPLPGPLAAGTTGTVAYRLSLEVRDSESAQGTTTSAAFTWSGDSSTAGPAPVPPAPATPTPALPTPGPPATSPSPEPSTTPEPSPTPEPSTTPTASTTPSPRPTRATPSPTSTASPGASPSTSPSGTTPEPSASPSGETGGGGDAGSGSGASDPGTDPDGGARSGSGSESGTGSGTPLGSVTVPMTPTSPAATPAKGTGAAFVQGAGRALSSAGRAIGGAGKAIGSGVKNAIGAALSTATDALRAWMPVAADAASPTAKGTAAGLATLPVVVLFLLLQRRIDRRDPKLALAPRLAEPDLAFDSVPRALDDGGPR